MSKVMYDLLMAISLVEKNFQNISDHSKYASMYMFTNENIKEITKKLNLSNKNILTVCSSGDQYFNFLLEKNTDVAVYDINIISKYILFLKEAAIRTLTYQEFLDFFFSKVLNNKKFFAKETYDKIKKNFKDKNAKIFWNYLFNTYSKEKLINSSLFAESPLSKKDIINFNNYLKSSENYNKLKSKLLEENKLKFYNIDIRQIPKLEEKFDFIYLSNILDSIEAPDKLTYLTKLKNIVLTLSKSLKLNGKLGVCYLYCYLDSYWDDIKNNMQSVVAKEENKNTFINKECQLIKFSSSLNNNSNRTKDKDALILYKKP